MDSTLPLPFRPARQHCDSASSMSKDKAKGDKAAVLYNTNLRADIVSEVNDKPKARVHSVEWRKVMNGDPVEINPSVGHGYKIMTVDEWAGRWKRNDDFPDCLNCGSKSTKEHHFTQVLHWASSFSFPCARVNRKSDLIGSLAFADVVPWEKEVGE